MQRIDTVHIDKRHSGDAMPCVSAKSEIISKKYIALLLDLENLKTRILPFWTYGVVAGRLAADLAVSKLLENRKKYL
jgi:hypothetical protein